MKFNKQVVTELNDSDMYNINGGTGEGLGDGDVTSRATYPLCREVTKIVAN